MVSMAFWHFNLGYMLQKPDYECTYLGERDYVACKLEKICSNDSKIVDWRVDWDSEKTLDNWIVKFDLHCEASWMLALPGALSFTGWTLGAFILPPMSDIYGRKMFVLAGQIGLLCFHLWMQFTKSYAVILTSAFILGFLSSVRLMIAYNYMVEMLPQRW